MGLNGPTKEASEKVCTGQKNKTSGAKALIVVVFYGPTKSCPDTKHEYFRSL
jgi:hypothetical protein